MNPMLSVAVLQSSQNQINENEKNEKKPLALTLVINSNSFLNHCKFLRMTL